MNSFFQYTIEVSVGLILFYGFYHWLLRNEVCLNYRRVYLMTTPILSLVLPLLKVPNFSSEPFPSYSLDFVAVSAISGENMSDASIAWNFWDIAGIVYLLGASIMAVSLIWKLGRVLLMVNGTRFPKIKKNGFFLRPTNGVLPSFTFFNHLFMDDLNTTLLEQSVVLEHEKVHVYQKHSLDVLFLELLKIFLWFNPFSWWYRKALQITHESIADAHAVRIIGLEKYMEVLASISLPKPYHSLVNHFNVHSTLNRIAMLKNLNRKVSIWKYLVVLPGLVGLILFQACQEDVGNAINTLAENSYTIEGETFNIYVTNNADDLVEKGKPEQRNMSHHRENNKAVTVRRWHGKWTFEIRNLEDKNVSYASAILANLQFKDVDYGLSKNREMLNKEFNDIARNIDNQQRQTSQQLPQGEDGVFNNVDEPPHPIGGMEAFYRFIAENLKYPESARKAGVQGKVYVTFVIDEAGSLTDLKVLKGIGGGCDEAALDALQLVKPWTPGKLDEKAVKVRMQMPIIFKLD